jgi:hypothetical protein
MMQRIASGLLLTLAVCLATTAHAGGSAPRIPDGVYRANVTEAFLLGVGINAGDAAHNSGVQTLLLKDRHWTNRTRNRYHPPDCSGSLSYFGSRVVLVADQGPQCGTAAGKRLFSARWSFANHQLRFTALLPKDLLTRGLWGGNAWKKIG